MNEDEGKTYLIIHINVTFQDCKRENFFLKYLPGNLEQSICLCHFLPVGWSHKVMIQNYWWWGVDRGGS